MIVLSLVQNLMIISFILGFGLGLVVAGVIANHYEGRIRELKEEQLKERIRRLEEDQR